MGLIKAVKKFLLIEDKDDYDEQPELSAEEQYIEKEADGLLKSLQELSDIAPSGVDVQVNQMLVGDVYCTVLMVTGYPSFLDIGWLDEMLSFGDDLDVSVHIDPVPGVVAARALNKRIVQIQSTLASQVQTTGMEDPEDVAKLEDAHELASALARGETQLFKVSIYFAIFMESQKELRKKIKKAENILGSRMLQTRPTTLQMEDGFTSILPVGKDKVQATRNMDTDSVATIFPFAGGAIHQPQGLIYGDNMTTGDMVIYNPWTLSKFNAITVGTTGGGKSMKEKREIALNRALYDTKVLCIDPNGEYGAGARWLDGEVVEFGSRSSDSYINPFDLPASDDPEESEVAFRKKVMFLHGFFTVLAQTRGGEGLSVEADNILDDAIWEVYRRFDITEDPDTHYHVPPLMTDLVEILEEHGGEAGARELLAYVKMFVRDGTLAGMFDKHTTVNLENRYIVFDILKLDEALWPPVMYMLMDFCWNEIVSGKKEKTLLVVDEAWRLMQFPATGQFLADLSRQVRKFYTGLHIITQKLEDFIGSDFGETIIDMSAMKWIHKLEHQQVEAVVEGFKLTGQETDFISSLSVGEALLIVEDGNHIAMRIEITNKEMELFTTDPRDRTWAYRK